jgi:hypothetical protein
MLRNNLVLKSKNDSNKINFTKSLQRFSGEKDMIILLRKNLPSMMGVTDIFSSPENLCKLLVKFILFESFFDFNTKLFLNIEFFIFSLNLYLICTERFILSFINDFSFLETI